MSIEIFLKDYFNEKMDTPAYLEKPNGLTMPFIVIDVTGVREMSPGVYFATVALQSYSHSKYEAEELNRAVMDVAEHLRDCMEIGGASLDTYTPFNDLVRKIYRYQAVYNIVFYDQIGGNT
jgi:hypothetical protein